LADYFWFFLIGALSGGIGRIEIWAIHLDYKLSMRWVKQIRDGCGFNRE
jgi:hypothetical protein